MKIFIVHQISDENLHFGIIWHFSKESEESNFFEKQPRKSAIKLDLSKEIMEFPNEHIWNFQKISK